jgi:hypothetical protein
MRYILSEIEQERQRDGMVRQRRGSHHERKDRESARIVAGGTGTVAAGAEPWLRRLVAMSTQARDRYG